MDVQSGGGVEGALVSVSGSTAQRSTFSAADGSYAFVDLEPAEYVLSVVHPGYDSARVRIVVRARSRLTVDLPLEPRPVPMAELVVNTDRLNGTHEGQPEPDSAAAPPARLGQIGRIGPPAAGALGDLVLGQIAREPPPGEPGGRQPHVLYIWGSTAGRGRVLLDGATLNAPLHLGGLLPALDPDVLARAELRTGGTSPRHDGGTTYLMDFGTRPAREALHVRADFDLLAAAATAEAPLGDDGGVLIGARRINRELVENVLERQFGYGYSDLLARADASFGAAGRVTATTFATSEFIELPRDLDEDRASWRNFATAVSFRPGAHGGALVNASFSRGIIDLPLLSAAGGHLQATVDRIAALAENHWSRGGTTVLAGLEVEALRFDRRSSGDTDPAEPDMPGPVECTPSLPCANVSATTIAPYGEVAWSLAPRLSARAGLRASYETGRERLSPLPRLSVTAVDRAGSTAVTLSAGRFSQVNTVEPAPTLGLPTATSLANTAIHTDVSYATQLEMLVSHRSARTILGASVLLHRQDADEAGNPPFTAPGADISLAYDGGDWRFAAGYAVLRHRAMPGDSAAADVQHLAAAGLGITRGRVSLDLESAWGHGMPLTSIVLERPAPIRTVVSQESAETIDDRSYFRVDALLSAQWSFHTTSGSFRLMPYARLVNGLSRRDALFYFQDGGSQPQPLASLAALPVLGVRIQF